MTINTYDIDKHVFTLYNNIGTLLFNLLESSDLKVVVAISADLAHTHDPNGPYGYSNASQPFDDVSSLSVFYLNMHTSILSYSGLRANEAKF